MDVVESLQLLALSAHELGPVMGWRAIETPPAKAAWHSSSTTDGIASANQHSSCSEWARHWCSWTLLSHGRACRMALWGWLIPKAIGLKQACLESATSCTQALKSAAFLLKQGESESITQVRCLLAQWVLLIGHCRSTAQSSIWGCSPITLGPFELIAVLAAI